MNKETVICHVLQFICWNITSPMSLIKKTMEYLLYLKHILCFLLVIRLVLPFIPDNTCQRMWQVFFKHSWVTEEFRDKHTDNGRQQVFVLTVTETGGSINTTQFSARNTSAGFSLSVTKAEMFMLSLCFMYLWYLENGTTIGMDRSGGQNRRDWDFNI